MRPPLVLPSYFKPYWDEDPVGIIYRYRAIAVVIVLALRALPELNSVCSEGGSTNKFASENISCKVLTYYSAILNFSASVLNTPSGLLTEAPMLLRVSTTADASWMIYWALPSPFKILLILYPSAMLILAYLSPSECKILLLFTLSDSDCNSILL